MFKRSLPKREKERVKVFLFKKETQVVALIDRNNQDSMTAVLMGPSDIMGGLCRVMPRMHAASCNVTSINGCPPL